MRFLQASTKKLFGERETSRKINKFVDLAPTSQADENGIYFEALDFATNNPNVFNIALTGPYGSGKSSVIKSFLKVYNRESKRSALEISLASFVSEPDASKGTTPNEDDWQGPSKSASRKSKISKQEIERSILQQMLYGADANRLPLSRFKRIQKPKWWAWLVSLVVMLGSASVWYLLHHKSEIISGDYFKPFTLSNWANLSVLAFSFLFVWLILHRLYLQSFGLTLKGISLKDIEIAPKAADEESILSRHLDEIIYFFQSTSYDLVVIEDLDRFDNPEIFITLREINGLINKNEGVNRHVRFLYALRDDMFDNTDRTKFFEFIVPVVPIINHSNSIDMVLKQGQRLSLVERLNQQFLREVSRYLSDLRLIRNIFNEYAIYAKNLESDDEGILDPNKLLAVLIYKNVLPNDFEALHQQKGALADLLSQYDDIVDRQEADIIGQIAKIEAEIAEAKKQLPKDVGELRKIYAMALIEKLPANHYFIRFGNNTTPIGQLSSREDLSQIIAADRILISPNKNGGWSQFDVKDIEAQVDERMTYAERQREIEKKSAKFVAQAGQRVSELQSKMSILRTQQFAVAVRANSQLVEDCFKGLSDKKELMKFLVFEGYLDDTYYQYISLFHEGRLSPHDNNFLRKIRSFDTPDPDFQIDNPAEVIIAMRAEDFGQSYVLNRHIVDYLLDNPSKYRTQIFSALGYIAANFDDCEAFFESYYERGRNVPKLVTSLMAQWPEFPAVAAESRRSVSHVARLTAYAPEQMLSEAPFADGPVAGCLSENAREVLSENVEFELSRLGMLRIEVTDLASLTDFPKVQEFVVGEGLYAINIPNIRFVLECSGNSTELSSLDVKHYSTVLGSDNDSLKRRVEADFSSYVRQVLLKLDDNTDEDGSAILAALRHDEVAAEFLEEFWSKQSTVLPLLSEIPHQFHPFALEYFRINASWENCLAFLSSESYSEARLTSYLEADSVMTALLDSEIPDDKNALPLRQFLLNNENFNNDTYRSYVRKLPKEFKEFPRELSREKLKIVIEERRVSFTAENFKLLEEQLDLKVLFVAQNIAAFLNGADEFEVDDDFRMELLRARIPDDHKREIVRDLDPGSIITDASRASVVGPILDKTSFDAVELGSDFLQAIIVNSKPVEVQVSLLKKSEETLSEHQVRGILEKLPEPYSDIATYGKSPKLENTSFNRSLARWLEQRQIISSWKPTFTEKEIRIYTFRSNPDSEPG